MKKIRIQDQKELLRSLGIFLLFAFVPVYIPTMICLIKDVPYMLEITAADGTTAEAINPAVQFLLAFSMLCPSIAMLISRAFCKEGFCFYGEDSMMLGIELTGRKWIWYLIALTAPCLYVEAARGTFLLLHPECFSTQQVKTLGADPVFLALYPFMGIFHAVTLSFGALGEEAGWRGYMMPRLEKLFGIKCATVVGGVIWGVWHYPALLLGHNFGHGYFLEPWSGFLVFTIYTVIMNAFLYLIVKKTGSVWPAAFFHASNNGVYSIVSLYTDVSKYKYQENAGLWLISLMAIYTAVLFSIILFAVRRKENHG